MLYPNQFQESNRENQPSKNTSRLYKTFAHNDLSLGELLLYVIKLKEENAILFTARPEV